MIKGTPKLSEMDLKRFYLPGMIYETTCVHCKSKISIDLTDHYPYSFEDSGKCQFSFCCPNCEGENNKELVLEIYLQEA